MSSPTYVDHFLALLFGIVLPGMVLLGARGTSGPEVDPESGRVPPERKVAFYWTNGSMMLLVFGLCHVYQEAWAWSGSSGSRPSSAPCS